MEKLVVHEAKDYGVISLNRPNKRNAISLQMASELRSALNSMKAAEIPFLVIKSTGDDVFCAGGDLRDLHAEMNESEALEKLSVMKEVLYEIVTFPVPVICLLQGSALGGGCELATACDIRIAKAGTNFGFVQSNLGILPGWGGGAILYEKIQPSFALNWLTEGEMYPANYLLDNNWIQKVAPIDDWYNEAAILQNYTSKSIAQMQFLKAQFLGSFQIEQLSKKMSQESARCASLWASEKHRAVLEQFYNK